jgi:hypothetical protein
MLSARRPLESPTAPQRRPPPGLALNQPVASEEIARFGRPSATRPARPANRELARLAGFERLRDLGVRPELPLVAEAAAQRGGAKRAPGVAAEIADLLPGVW